MALAPMYNDVGRSQPLHEAEEGLAVVLVAGADLVGGQRSSSTPLLSPAQVQCPVSGLCGEL